MTEVATLTSATTPVGSTRTAGALLLTPRRDDHRRRRSQRGTFTASRPSDARARTSCQHHATLGPPPAARTATLDVVSRGRCARTAEIDIVTGADSWDGFGGGAYDQRRHVRVDQTSIKIDIASAAPTPPAPSSTSTATGTGLTFGGKPTTTVVQPSSTPRATARSPSRRTRAPSRQATRPAFGSRLAGGSTSRSRSQRTRRPRSPRRPRLPVEARRARSTITVTVTDQFGIPVAGASGDRPAHRWRER